MPTPMTRILAALPHDYGTAVRAYLPWLAHSYSVALASLSSNADTRASSDAIILVSCSVLSGSETVDASLLFGRSISGSSPYSFFEVNAMEVSTFPQYVRKQNCELDLHSVKRLFLLGRETKLFL